MPMLMLGQPAKPEKYLVVYFEVFFFLAGLTLINFFDNDILYLTQLCRELRLGTAGYA